MRLIKITSVRKMLHSRSRMQEARRPVICTLRNQDMWGECKDCIGITAWGAPREFNKRITRAAAAIGEGMK